MIKTIFFFIKFILIKEKKKLNIFFSDGYYSWNFLKDIFSNIEEDKIYLTLSLSEYNFLKKKINKDNLYLCNSNIFVVLWINNIICKNLITTLPDLNTYFWKKSKFVKNYIYIFHSLGSTFYIYNDKAFDYFDHIMCTNQYQFDELEKRKKDLNLSFKLHKSGFIHLDNLINDRNDKQFEKERKVLIAPTWSINDKIFSEYLISLVENLIEEKVRVILRLHPMNKEKFINVFNTKSYFKEIVVDNSNNYRSFNEVDLLITDWSTIACEFFYSQRKNVIFINTPPKKRNKNIQENKLIETFEYIFRQSLGNSFNVDEIKNINFQFINQIISNSDTKIDKCREIYKLFNVGNSLTSTIKNITTL